MKKSLLLAGVACLFSVSANAMDYRPYVGLDYIYSDANIKKEFQMKDEYNSGAINAGMQFGDFTGIEAFFQQSGERTKDVTATQKNKGKFNAYGLDWYGYMPIPACNDTFSLVGTFGVANYNMEAKYRGDVNDKIDKDRLGYRVGLGAQYNFTDHIGARLVGRYSYIGAKALKDLKEISLGMRYTF